ncbi:peptidase M24 [Russula earlei]|uniref:Peptidase M24 n=1 Tax=Russula earlei TaxID=71964 RepID=A0ACC0U1H5_9AGAM|nr:peptidase M24 [Russula earlei]
MTPVNHWRSRSNISPIIKQGRGCGVGTPSVCPLCPRKAHRRVFLHPTLATALHAHNASAYIAEPGASPAYFANVSASAWPLSGRPFLLFLAPQDEGGDASATAACITVLTPEFEATLARSLPVPASPAHGVSYITWADDADPYETALSVVPRTDADTDPNSRGAASDTVFVDGGIRRLRERKSREELEVLICANEVTVLNIRALRRQFHVGIHESESRRLLQHALADAGLKNGDGLVLFDENAAWHGSGKDRVLEPNDLVLVSDVTRSFYSNDSTPKKHPITLWNQVHEAQALAITAAHAATLTFAVDEAAHDFLNRRSLTQYFTHRLGDGIGLEGHESPYLRGGSNDIIKIGHTFSNEPGIYIEGEVNLRCALGL